MHTMRQESWEVIIFEGIFGFYIDRNLLSNLYLLLMFFPLVWKLCKSLHFRSVKIHKHCLYWKAFCTNIYRKAFFNSLLFFQLYFLASKLQELSQEIPPFFLGCLETNARFIFESFKYCPLWKVLFQCCSTLLAFFIWSLNCSWDFFGYFFTQLSHSIM